MKILLDTHIFLWFISGDAQLPKGVRDAIREPNGDQIPLKPIISVPDV